MSPGPWREVPLNIDIKFWDEEIAVVTCIGDMDVPGSKVLRDTFVNLNEQGFHRILVDLSQVTYIDWGSEIRFRLSCGQLRGGVVLVGESAGGLFPVDPVPGEDGWPRRGASRDSAAGRNRLSSGSTAFRQSDHRAP